MTDSAMDQSVPTAPLMSLTPDGALVGPASMPPDQVLQALQLMLTSRALDELAIKLQRLKRIALYAPVEGQEAAVVGPAMALDPDRDWMVPASREQPAMLRHGLPLANLLAGYMGRSDFAGIPEAVRLLPRQQAIAAQLPHAAGLAWALKLRRERAVVLAFCGDGASSEGDFHEALNLAGVTRVPLVVVLVNNRYAISTPLRKQTAASSLAERARGYGFPGVLVDGNDVFATHAATLAAVERALEGEGPTLVECLTYRMGFHNTSDNPDEYRDRAELELARTLDPVARLRRYSERTGLARADEIARMDSEIRADLNQLYREVSARPGPDPRSIFRHAYSDPPARVREQERAIFGEGSG